MFTKRLVYLSGGAETPEAPKAREKSEIKELIENNDQASRLRAESLYDNTKQFNADDNPARKKFFEDRDVEWKSKWKDVVDNKSLASNLKSAENSLNSFKSTCKSMHEKAQGLNADDLNKPENKDLKGFIDQRGTDLNTVQTTGFPNVAFLNNQQEQKDYKAAYDLKVTDNKRAEAAYAQTHAELIPLVEESIKLNQMDRFDTERARVAKLKADKIIEEYEENEENEPMDPAVKENLHHYINADLTNHVSFDPEDEMHYTLTELDTHFSTIVNKNKGHYLEISQTEPKKVELGNEDLQKYLNDNPDISAYLYGLYLSRPDLSPNEEKYNNYITARAYSLYKQGSNSLEDFQQGIMHYQEWLDDEGNGQTYTDDDGKISAEGMQAAEGFNHRTPPENEKLKVVKDLPANLVPATEGGKLTPLMIERAVQILKEKNVPEGETRQFIGEDGHTYYARKTEGNVSIWYSHKEHAKETINSATKDSTDENPAKAAARQAYAQLPPKQQAALAEQPQTIEYAGNKTVQIDFSESTEEPEEDDDDDTIPSA